MTVLRKTSTHPRWVEGWRSFKMAAWLGWKIESNWADPFLFFVYSVVKPLAGAAILVVMYSIITQADFDRPLFPYIYLGNAFYIYVGAIVSGVAWAVVDDREHYKTLKYMYIAPIRIPSYLFGRGVARFLTGSISVLITLMAGVLVLKLPLDPLLINWPLFILSLFLGVFMLAMLGLLIGSITLLLVHHSWGIADAVAGALFLFSGAVFPLDVLPAWLRPVGYAMPLTYWLELLRRSLVGDIAQAFPTLTRFSSLELLGILVGLALLFGILTFFVFRWCDYQARERGTIDMTSHY